MQESNDQMHTQGRRWRRRLRLLLTVLPLGFLWSATDVAATMGALVQLLGTATSGLGCISEDGTKGTCTDGQGLSGAGSVVVSPDGRYVYAASFNSSAVTTFVRNTATGGLGQLNGIAGCVSDIGDGVTCGRGRGLNGAVFVAVSPDGQHVYVASRDSNAVAIFVRNVTTGVLTQLPGLAGCIAENGDGITCAVGAGLREAVFLTVSPDGTNLHVASQISDAVAIFSRNKMTGALTQPATPGSCVSEDGSDDGMAKVCADGNGLLGAIAVTVGPDGHNVYAASYISNALTVFNRE